LDLWFANEKAEAVNESVPPLGLAQQRFLQPDKVTEVKEALQTDCLQPLLALSIAQVVRCSGLSRTLVYQEMRAGRLLARKCGRRTVILQTDLEAFLSALPAAGARNR
jgi:hypothetical protein